MIAKITKFTAMVLTLCTVFFSSVTFVQAAQIKEENSVATVNKILPSTSDEAMNEYDENNLPEYYSSVELGYVTEIKNQKFNDCWAYAGLGAFESKLLHDGEDIESMSINHINAWATTHSDGYGWKRNLQTDGYAEICTGYLTSWYGGVAQSKEDLFDFSEDVKGDSITNEFSEFGTTAIKYLEKSDVNGIKRSIYKNGGVYTAYAQSSTCSYENGTAYYMPENYTGGYLGHAVEVVGWDDNFSKETFKRGNVPLPQNDGAWLIRNSWGDYNSLGGYFWISYEDKYIFSEKYSPSYTIESYEKIENKKLIQNEIFGATYEFSYAKSNEITYINKFDFDEEYRYLDKVVFETTALGADYEIFYVPLNKDNEPVFDKESWNKLYSGKADYKGYICVDIENLYLEDNTGAIAITVNTQKVNEGKSLGDKDYVLNSIGVNEWLQDYSGDYIFVNKSEYGKSYIMYGDEKTDLMDWYLKYNNDKIGGTFVIKAVTCKEEKTPEHLFADVDMNGTVNILDATAIQKHLAKIEALSGEALEIADTNNDGNVNILDATIIQKLLAKIDIYEMN